MSTPSTSDLNPVAEYFHDDDRERQIPLDSFFVGDDNIDEPFIGMEFMDIEGAYQFYNSYASVEGFSVRKFTHRISTVTNKPTFIKYVCSKQGEKKSKKNKELLSGQRTPEKDRSSTRCGCKAFMDINYSKEDAKWRISQLCKEHNHVLLHSPSKKRILRSQKHMSEEQRDLVRLLGDHGITPGQIMEILATKAGGRDNLGFSRKDVGNILSRENRKLSGVDVDSTILYFNQLQRSDPDFFFAVETDEDNTVKHLFWVNGRSRRSYREFGDVVVFDTTYSTNKYCMPCAPFVGVNHHRQSIFFGCALLRDEKMSTFEWLFETWLKAMDGKHPQSIITDQDPSMKGAIAKLFPNTVHRCCQWHVMRKASEKLGKLYDSKMGFENELFACINAMTVDEFEIKWKNMIRTYNLGENQHLNTMFTTASQWVPAYFKDTFFAEMTTSQRSESMNAAMKLWLDSHTYICNFVIQFEKITTSIFANESEEDMRTINNVHTLWSDDEIEEKAREVYTRNVFYVFREILKEASGFIIEVLDSDKLYKLKSQKLLASYKVQVDRPNYRISCECKGFEFDGLLCAHVIKVMQSIGMNYLPSHYILKRWTKDANKDTKKPVCGTNMEIGGPELERKRLAILNEKCNKICNKAVKNSDAFATVCAKLDKLHHEINSIQEEGLPVNPITDVPDNQSLGDPPVSQCKGKRKPQRMKPLMETNAKKRRTCSICKKKDGHNAKTCPKKGKLDTKDKNHTHGIENIGDDDYGSGDDYGSDD